LSLCKPDCAINPDQQVASDNMLASKRETSPERLLMPLSAASTRTPNPLAQPAASRQSGISLPDGAGHFDATMDTRGPVRRIDSSGLVAEPENSAVPRSDAGITVPLASLPPMPPRMMTREPPHGEGFSMVPPDLARRLAELANPPGRTPGATGAGAVKSARVATASSSAVGNPVAWPNNPDRDHLVTIPAEQAEALLQAWRAAGRSEQQQQVLPLNPSNINAKFHDFGTEVTSDFATVVTASGVRPPPFPPLPPSLEPLPRARSGGLGDIRPTSMAGLGNQLFGLAFSKFGSAYSQSEASDGEWDRFSKVMGADSDDPYRRTRRKGMIRINSDGTAKVGRFRISDCGITTPVRGERPVHATIPFRSAFLRLEVVGKGASGEVYKAVHVPTLTLVAAKNYILRGQGATP
jgi:hypothetical protein